jgi:serine/threonine protein phosphatase PrpC
MRALSPAICPGCGTPTGGTGNFCEACGQELAVTSISTGTPAVRACPNCRSSHFSADGYCQQCGLRAPAGRDHAELALSGIAGVTDRGLRHHRNEDALALAAIHTPAGPATMAVVCDGVSTSGRPDEASAAAAERAIDTLTATLRAGAAGEEALIAAVLAANSAVCDLAGNSANPPAATYVSGVVTSAAVSVCWVGDSRAYWLPAGPKAGARLLTRDDSVVGHLVARGLMAEADATAAPGGHVVTGWLGADAGTPEPHSLTIKEPGHGVLLLCSDGLWNYQPDADELMRLTLPTALTDLPGAAAELLAFALDGGGRDNITIALIAVPPGSAFAAADHRSAP